MSSPWLLLALWIWLLTLATKSVLAVKDLVLEDNAVEARSSTSNDTGVTWFFPSTSSTSSFNSVDTVNASWSSPYGEPNLRLLCKGKAQPRSAQRSSVNVTATGSQAVLMNVIQKINPLICHFVLVDQLKPTSTSNSPFFAVTNVPSAKPQTWSANGLEAPPTTTIASSDLTAPTSTYTAPPQLNASSSISTSAAAAAAAATSSTSSNASSTDDSTTGLSTVAGVGIGVGVAVAVVALAMGGLLFYLHVRRRRRLKAHQSTRPIKIPTTTTVTTTITGGTMSEDGNREREVGE